MGRPPPQASSPHVPFAWHRALSTVLFAAAALAFYGLSEHRILSEEQLILLLFIALPVGAFALSGMGQDGSDSLDA
ncbi:hypothetical protein [Rhizorhabdus wittichii]|uniref:hypothetical protein n=1 Tax=Rhizorhabdus wittichii TaxID=160791 RepID=UPI00055D34C4|nr:hypothetical protein [Rhizorhabdus wittichii]